MQFQRSVQKLCHSAIYATLSPFWPGKLTLSNYSEEMKWVCRGGVCHPGTPTLFIIFQPIPPSELGQKPQVVGPEVAYVLDVMSQHGDPFRAHAEGEP